MMNNGDFLFVSGLFSGPLYRRDDNQNLRLKPLLASYVVTWDVIDKICKQFVQTGWRLCIA